MIKQVSIDWDSVSAVDKQIRVLKQRKRELENTMGGAMPIVGRGKKFAAYREIWDSDISRIYEPLSLDKNKSFYVYAHLNPLEPIDVARSVDAFAATLGMEFRPFYIGKGTSSRDANLRRNETHRKVAQQLSALGKEFKVIRLLDNLNEAEAYQAEAKLIDIFGIISNGGILCNLDEGYRRLQRRMIYRDALRTLSRTLGDYERVKVELYNNQEVFA